MSLKLNACGIERAGEDIRLVIEREYGPGDEIALSADEPGRHAVIRFDETLPPTLVYLAGPEFRFPVPFGEARAGYSPRAFAGTRHLVSARYATAAEISAYRNLALNPHDTSSNGAAFPHAEANAVTRGENAFAARNAVDGLTANDGHGEWPWTSWGINRDPRACLTVRFGRPVTVDRAAVYLRADFPHDAWWRSGVLLFSDGGEVPLALEKTGAAQEFAFSARKTEWVRLERLVKADDPSPFPALTQLGLYGTEAER